MAEEVSVAMRLLDSIGNYVSSIRLFTQAKGITLLQRYGTDASCHYKLTERHKKKTKLKSKWRW